MDFAPYIRKPFQVEAVEITELNMGEVSSLIGKVDTDDEGKACITITRKGVPGASRVYPGFWVTKMGNNVRCYSSKAFKNQFVDGNSEVLTWLKTFDEYSNQESNGG